MQYVCMVKIYWIDRNHAATNRKPLFPFMNYTKPKRIDQNTFVFLYCLCFYLVLFALMPFHIKYRHCDCVLFENFSVFPIYSNVTSIYRDISSAPVHTPLHVNIEYFLQVVYTAVHATQTTETYIKSVCGKSIQNM